MTTILNQLSDNEGARKSRMRVGRGIGSGKGKTCGRGHKGQKSRSGVSINGFEGGQQPIYRRLPKRGFNNYNRKELEVINLGDIQRFADAGRIDIKKPITVELLISSGILKGNKDGIKLLGKGELKAKVTIEVDSASESAIKAIEKAGGKVSILERAAVAEEKEVKKAPVKKAAKK